ncbi:MAG: 4-(cytidine 5'-diphospho)-2-C-methyl-D-erythritol kinase [Corynebacterium sp.]|nr:4-(cytidine 5'-diphospho)-2-C-methyl-D-erythritol kinase [Corynebacterium sp.]
MACVITAVTVHAHAKVNLFLDVVGLRDDGYHELSTVFQSVSLHDTVTVAVSDEMELTVDGVGIDVAGVPTDASNLAWQAAQLVLGDQPVAIHIEKVLPTAGGMAGGSADAAAVLVGANRLRRDPLTVDQVDELALQLGSDVPFVLHGGTMLATGRGEKLSNLHSHGTYFWVFATAPEGLSTPEVFRTYDALTVGTRVHTVGSVHSALAVIDALPTGDPEQLAAALYNDLEQAAVHLRPELRELIDVGVGAGALTGIVSGSGPTVAFLCVDEPMQEHVAHAVTASHMAAAAFPATSADFGAHIVGEH